VQFDSELPPSQLSVEVQEYQTVRHFAEAYGIRVDLDGLDALPALERLSLAGARLPEPPESVLLDRVLQLVPPALLEPVERLVIVASRGTGRQGSARRRIVRLSAQEARIREGDYRFGNRFSLFTTTVLHEIGHVVFEERLTQAQQEDLLTEYLRGLDAQSVISPGEPSQAGLEHHFIRLFIAALLGRGEPPVSASAARQRLAEIGLELRAR
jgi:hypothetical protein